MDDRRWAVIDRPSSIVHGSGPDSHIYRPDSARRGPAVASMFLSAFLFAVMGVFARLAHEPAAGRPLPASEVTLFRFAFGFLVMLPLHGRRGINLIGRDRWGLATRGISGGLAVYLYFLALQHTSLAHAVLLNYTSLIFAPLFAALFLKERIGPRTAGAIALAAVGILAITRPSSGELNVGDLYGLLSGFCSGAAITAIRRLRKTESAMSIFFYLSWVGIPIALATCVAEPVVVPTAAGWSILTAMATASVAAQLIMTYGYKYVRAAEGSLVMISQVIYSAAAGALWFMEPVTATTIVGGALVLAASLWMNVLSQNRGV